MTFFPEIDVIKTKKNAQKKLNEYRRWAMVAGEVDTQKVTATYSFEPRQSHSTPSKPVERLAINRVFALQELEAIEWGIDHLFEPVHRRILTEKYIFSKRDWEIYTELGYEKTQYYAIRDKALVAFAHLYRNGILVVENGKTAE